MLHNFIQNTINYLADNFFIGIVNIVLGISKGLFIILDQVFFGPIGFVLISTFIAVVLNKNNSQFHWTQLEKSPTKFIKNCYNHKVIRRIARVYISAMTLPFFILGTLKFILVIWPEDGMHILDMMQQKELVMQAFGGFFILSLCGIALKAIFYVMMGFIEKYSDFTLKMIIC